MCDEIRVKPTTRGLRRGEGRLGFGRDRGRASGMLARMFQPAMHVWLLMKRSS